MRFGSVALDEAEGAVLAHSVRGAGIAFKKGRVLSAKDVVALREAGIADVIAARLDADDVPEDEAARLLATALCGAALTPAEPFTGRANLFAAAAGVLVVDKARIDRINEVHEAITVATLPEFAVVQPRDMTATIKIIPFAAPRAALDEVQRIAGEVPALRIAPWRGVRARLIQTTLPATSAKMLDKTVAVTRARIAEVGGTLGGESRCAHATPALADAIRDAIAAGTDLLLIAGASAITDRRDVLPAGIEAAGGTVEHFGMPVDPGNLILTGRIGDVPVLGLPGCARSPKLNGFDWVLQRLAAGIPVRRQDIMAMGVGGLLSEIGTRPQPRDGKDANVVPRAPRIAVLVLAAGRSSRMGPRNKLLVEVDGRPILRHAVDAALASQAVSVTVVTGHMGTEVAARLDGLPVAVVHNPDFAQGMSTSLKLGLAALPAEIDGVIVALGDMPRVTPRLFDRLIAAFAPVEGRSIVVATSNGKRGNPVLFAKPFIEPMRRLTGDIGARAIIAQNEDVVVEIEAGDAALLDVDTPEALSALVGAPA